MKIFSYFSSICLEYFGLNIAMGKGERIGMAFHFWNFFCWNKLYILGCIYIVYNILDMWTLCGVS